MLLLELPNEILWTILHFVPPRDSLCLLKTCKSLYQLKQDELFWREFARQYGMIYLHPHQTWWQFYISGDLKKTCPHIHDRFFMETLTKKAMVFWNTLLSFSSSFQQQQQQQQQPSEKEKEKEEKRTSLFYACCQEQGQKLNGGGLCLSPHCQFVGCGDAFFSPEANPGHLREHYHATGHTCVLKLSSLHFCELFCYACNKPVGFWGFPSMEKPIGERYLVRSIVQTLVNTFPKDPYLKNQAIERRRAIERRLVWSQQSHEDSYIIERSWFMAWNEFLFEKTDQIPGVLLNKSLFCSMTTNTLRSDIELGTDFELVGGVVRSYIERVYDIDGPVVSAYELQWKPEYRKICESILFRRHIMQRGPQGIPSDP
ncbi:hypothetical protein BDA99DRAFT_522475 [Phascolomyces articulosus]|uniref:F-box domain-containing protein n=1 Tax=Phascolomyces articulosus TaxID=60185 RepID=A0AAD5PBD6_9FUNG|nr:hypothetical protein BDA99DRAFT_522475 [Phascolomyces articulosus]